MHKKHLAILAAVGLPLALGALPVLAKFHQARGQMAAFQRIADEIGLTASQKGQVLAILADARTQAKALRADSSLTSEERQARRDALRDSVWQRLQGVLTPAQQETLKAKGGLLGLLRHDPAVQARLERVASALDLSGAQRSQIRSIFDAAAQQAQAIQQDTTLTAQERRAKLRSVFQDAKRQTLSLLTPQQREKARSLWSHHRRYAAA